MDLAISTNLCSQNVDLKPIDEPGISPTEQPQTIQHKKELGEESQNDCAGAKKNKRKKSKKNKSKKSKKNKSKKSKKNKRKKKDTCLRNIKTLEDSSNETSISDESKRTHQDYFTTPSNQSKCNYYIVVQEGHLLGENDESNDQTGKMRESQFKYCVACKAHVVCKSSVWCKEDYLTFLQTMKLVSSNTIMITNHDRTRKINVSPDIYIFCKICCKKVAIINNNISELILVLLITSNDSNISNNNNTYINDNIFSHGYEACGINNKILDSLCKNHQIGKINSSQSVELSHPSAHSSVISLQNTPSTSSITIRDDFVDNVNDTVSGIQQISDDRVAFKDIDKNKKRLLQHAIRGKREMNFYKLIRRKEARIRRKLEIKEKMIERSRFEKIRHYENTSKSPRSIPSPDDESNHHDGTVHQIHSGKKSLDSLSIQAAPSKYSPQIGMINSSQSEVSLSKANSSIQIRVNRIDDNENNTPNHTTVEIIPSLDIPFPPNEISLDKKDHCLNYNHVENRNDDHINIKIIYDKHLSESNYLNTFRNKDVKENACIDKSGSDHRSDCDESEISFVDMFSEPISKDTNEPEEIQSNNYIQQQQQINGKGDEYFHSIDTTQHYHPTQLN